MKEDDDDDDDEEDNDDEEEKSIPFYAEHESGFVDFHVFIISWEFVYKMCAPLNSSY